MDKSEIFVSISAEIEEPPSISVTQIWVAQTFHQAVSESPAQMNVRYCTASEIQASNLEFRGLDYPTNVLSFTISEKQQDWFKKVGEPRHLGDIMVCPSIVRQEADAMGIDYQHRLAHIVIHGTLHLLDFDHMNDEERQKMEAMESQIMLSLNYPDPWRNEDE